MRTWRSCVKRGTRRAGVIVTSSPCHPCHDQPKLAGYSQCQSKVGSQRNVDRASFSVIIREDVTMKFCKLLVCLSSRLSPGVPPYPSGKTCLCGLRPDHLEANSLRMLTTGSSSSKVLGWIQIKGLIGGISPVHQWFRSSEPNLVSRSRVIASST